MLTLGEVHQLLGLGSARVSGPSDGLPGACLWPGAAPLLRDNSLGPPGNNQNLTTKGAFGEWSQAVAKPQRQRYDIHAGDRAAATSPGEAAIAPCPDCPITGKSLRAVTTTSVILRSSPQIGVGYGDYLAGDMIAPSRPSHCLILLFSLN